MSKERLEQIKENEMNFHRGYEDLESDFSWLAEQAERTQVLESENKRYRYTTDYLKLKLSDFHLYAYEIREVSEEKMIKDDADWLKEDILNTLRALEADK